MTDESNESDKSNESVEIDVFNNTERPRTVTLQLTPYDEDAPVTDERTIRVPGIPGYVRHGTPGEKRDRDELPNHRAVHLDRDGTDALTCTVSVQFAGRRESRSASVDLYSNAESPDATTVASLDPASETEVDARADTRVDGVSDFDVVDPNDAEVSDEDGDAAATETNANVGAETPGRGRKRGRKDEGVVLELQRFVDCGPEA